MRQKVEEECDTVRNKEGLAWPGKTNGNIQKKHFDFLIDIEILEGQFQTPESGV